MVPIMLRDAIAHLRDGGYGFVVLAMRVKFAEMEKFPNLTMFALDDQAIFVGGRQVRPVAGGAPVCQARKSERPTLLLFFKTSKRYQWRTIFWFVSGNLPVCWRTRRSPAVTPYHWR